MPRPTADITVQRNGGFTDMTIPTDAGMTKFELTNEAAQKLAGKLLTATAGSVGTDPEKLFDGPRFVSLSEPKMAIRRMPSGNVALAVQAPGLLPIVVEYEPNSARIIGSAISKAVDVPPRII
jgi:hypothetical protein